MHGQVGRAALGLLRVSQRLLQTSNPETVAAVEKSLKLLLRMSPLVAWDLAKTVASHVCALLSCVLSSLSRPVWRVADGYDDEPEAAAAHVPRGVAWDLAKTVASHVCAPLRCCAVTGSSCASRGGQDQYACSGRSMYNANQGG